MNHYVYRITNTKLNKHYYGTRSCKINPSEDIGHIYFSSSSDKEFIRDQKNNKRDYFYKVVYIHSSRKKAIEQEIRLHQKFNVGINESFYNKAKQTSSGFDNQGGYKWPLESKNMVKGITTYKNSNGDTFRVAKNDPRVISGELVNFNKGTTYKNNKELVEIRRKALSGSNNPMANKIKIFNNMDELIFECFGNFDYICEKNNLPKAALKTSYLKKTKLYQNSPKGTIKKLEKLGIYGFKGWYARKI